MRIVFLNVEIDAPPPVIQMNYCEVCGRWFHPNDTDSDLYGIIDYVDIYDATVEAAAKGKRPPGGKGVTVPPSVAERQVHDGMICSIECYEEAEKPC